MIRHPSIDDKTLLQKYPAVVDHLSAGGSVRGAKEAVGCSASTASFIRAAMVRQGWVLEARRNITREERLEKYPHVVFWLRAGKSAEWTARMCEVSNATVLTVRYALLANGEKLVKWKRIGWPSKDRET